MQVKYEAEEINKVLQHLHKLPYGDVAGVIQVLTNPIKDEPVKEDETTD